MKFKKEDLLEIISGYDSGELTAVDEGEWDGGGKYQYKTSVFTFEGEWYAVDDSRTGSYYTDYCWDHEKWPDEVECYKVHKVTKTIEVWEKVQ